MEVYAGTVLPNVIFFGGDRYESCDSMHTCKCDLKDEGI